MREEKFGGKLFSFLTVFHKKAPANFVPAAAVIRGVLALSGIIGRKGSVGGLTSQLLNTSA